MIVQSVAVRPDYFDEETRRGTFKSWVFSSNEPCSADKMAEAGFIYTGSTREPDCAECFYCNKSLDGWEPSDDPWKEHLKHRKTCDFAKMQKSQLNWTLKEWHKLRFKYTTILIKIKYEDLKSKKQKQFEKIRTDLIKHIRNA